MNLVGQKWITKYIHMVNEVIDKIESKYGDIYVIRQADSISFMTDEQVEHFLELDDEDED